MTPPPPKFGSRNLFNDSFLSFLRWNNNKSQLAPPVHHPDSPGGTEELQEKRYLLSEGHEFLDKTKSMLEEYSYILGKEATKRFRKMAAKLTKNAPSKAKLPKKTLGDVSGFHQNATELYQEVENILREFEQQPPHPDVVADPHHSVGRSRSSSPAPLPRKAPSPKVTFNTEMQPESKVNLTRKESTRRGVELRDESRPVGHHAVDLARQDSAKPSSSSKNRDSKEEDLTRSTSHRDGRSRKHDRDDRQEVERYRKPDDQRRSDSRRYTTDQYQSRNRDRSDPYRDREREYKQRYYDPRDHRRGYEDDYYDYDRSRHRKQDRRRDERDDIPPQNNKVSSRRNDPPMRIVHEDSPLPGPAPPADGVPFAPTYVDYPTDRREKEKRERDRERDWGGGRGDRDRDRERRDRDRPRKTDEYYYDNKPRRREYERDDEYKHRGYDKYAKPRRYEDEYRPRDRDREERDRDREPRPDKARDREPRPDRGDRDRGERDRGDRDRGDRDRGDRDRGDRDRGDRDRGGKDRGGKDRGERERGDRDRGDRDRGDRERERGDRDREKDREKSHPPQTMHPHEGSPPPSPGGDPSGSKFQEVFTPDPHRSDALPQHPEADAGA